jgi:hypothetical protein
MSYLQNYVFIDKSVFNINMRPSYGRAAPGTPAVTTTLTTRAESHSILGAISIIGVVNVNARTPQMNRRIRVTGGRKRKAVNSKKKVKKNWYYYWVLF